MQNFKIKRNASGKELSMVKSVSNSRNTSSHEPDTASDHIFIQWNKTLHQTQTTQHLYFNLQQNTGR